MKLYEITFSPTGGTQKAADLLTETLGGKAVAVDLADSTVDRSALALTSEDVAVIAVPSYGGRVPATAVQRLRAVQGGNARAVLLCVYGNRAYGAWTVQEASGIEAGDRLLSLNNARACGKIKTALPYVDTVRIGIKLPDTVNIYIEEFDVAYAIQTGDGTWWLMTSQGKAVEQIDGGTAGSYTKVLGVTLDNPVEGEPVKAVITQDAPASTQTEEGATVPAGETIPVTVTGTDRLNAALHILSCLENNDIVGEVASVDVSSLSNIELWYGQRFQVKLGDTGDMEKKITYMNRAISQLNDYEMGVLDVSFTTWPDQPGYTPFE